MNTNLMVLDMDASLGFYHDVIGLPITFTVDADQNTDTSGEVAPGAVFASLSAGTAGLMLQTRESLAEDAPMVSVDDEPAGTFTIYFRVDDVDAVVDRLPAGTEIVKPLQVSWYGMKEIWFRDPDGYVVTVATPDGDGPS